MAYREPLTKREREVLAPAARGFTNKEIAEMLGISGATVRRHLHSIYAKLEVSPGESAGATARIRAALEEKMLVYVGPEPLQR